MKKISANELKKMIEQGDVLLVDVREPAEHRAECIEGACLIPLSTLTAEKLPNKTRRVVVHCRSGRRSEEACERLLKAHPELDVASLEGGITAWEKAGFPVKRGEVSVLSLDRQTQIAAGSLALGGTLLGAFVHPVFYIVSGFAGAGLIFAGVTGWCGMAKLLAKMPWNQ